MSVKLILLRHGKSAWNEQNLFTGWVDIPLTKEGMDEALSGGRAIREIPIDAVFTSSLMRARMTVPLALLGHGGGKIPVFLHPGEGKLEEWGRVYSEEAEKTLIPVFSSWELNERMYGKLQGLNKKETAETYGAEQVHLWRRSFDGRPPEGESLAMTAARTLPYFKKQIAPWLEQGKTVLICAHGNSLRSIAMEIEGLSPEEIVSLELGTGEPRIYSYREGRYDLSR